MNLTRPAALVTFLSLCLALGFFGACSDVRGSACFAGEACERVLLNNCTCCAGFAAVECRQDRQERCGGGSLVVPWFPHECEAMVADWNAIKADGTDPCDLLTEKEREQACQNFISDGVPNEPRQREPQTF